MEHKLELARESLLRYQPCRRLDYDRKMGQGLEDLAPLRRGVEQGLFPSL